MAELVASTVTKAVKLVLRKLTTFGQSQSQSQRQSQIQSLIQFIKSELEAIQSLLPKIRERELVMEVRELSYDIEDAIEDAIDDFIQQRTNTGPFEDLKIKVKDLSERLGLCENWKTAETISNSSKPVVDPRARFLHKDASELVGMDELKDELIELLVQRVDKRRDASRRRIGIPHHGTTQMKQKIVIKVQMADNKSRSKAMALVEATGGVDSVALTGEGKDHVVVMGDGMDAIKLTSALRKKVGHANLVQVGHAKKVEAKPAAVAVVDYPSQPAQINGVCEHPAAAHGYQPFDELKIVCILGFAGGGKTTLADLAYHAAGGQFECRAFVSVSRSPNITEILRAILTQVTDKRYAGTEAAAEQYLIDNISKFLADKRYLVIIDDIWHWEEWQIIREHLPKNNLGSRIIMTTRINVIAEKCLTNDNDAFVYEIGVLDSLDAWTLSDTAVKSVARYRPGIDEDNPCYDIVEMCYGMPLALICMSSALAEQIQGLDGELQNLRALRRVEDGFLKIPSLKPLAESLCLGYDDLPLHLMILLLYCSIYRWRDKFGRDSLVRRWIAEGFVYEEEAADCLTQKEETAEGCFDELVDREWIKPVGGRKYEIHPVMLAFLRCKSQEDNFVTCLGFCSDISSLCTRRIRRLSLQHGHSVDFSRMDLSHARSLVVFDDASAVPFKRFERLRVLDLEDTGDLENAHMVDICGLLRLRYLGLKGTPISELPPQIWRLQRLETLDVSGTKVRQLPREIGRLQHLKTLDVSGTKVRQLPREIGTLQHLKTLDVSGTKVSELPPQIGTLQHLETLDVSGTKVSELPPQIGTLQHLKTLDVSGTKVSELPPEIWTLQHLETLDVRNTMVSELPLEAGEILKSVRVLAGDEDSRQGVKPPEDVSQASSLPNCREVLSIMVCYRFGMGTVPPHVGVFKVRSRHMCIPPLIKEHFSVLSSLDIRLCKLDTEGDDLKFLREMPNLQTLVVRFEVLPRKPIAISGEGFAMLESFCVDSRMPRVTFGQGAMPNLKRLAFRFYAGPAGEDHVGITHLRSLEKVAFRCSPWYKSDSPGISATVAVVRREAGEHPNRITLCINDDEEEIFPEKDSAQICQENRGAGSRSGTEADKLDDDRNSLAGNDNTEETFQAEKFASCSRTNEIEEIEAQEYSCSLTEH